jgi:hypothetical protein
MENEQALITKATTNSVAGLTHISIIAKATLFVGARCRVPAVSLSHCISPEGARVYTEGFAGLKAHFAASHFLAPRLP